MISLIQLKNALITDSRKKSNKQIINWIGTEIIYIKSWAAGCYNEEKSGLTEPKECLKFTACQKISLIGDFDDKAKNVKLLSAINYKNKIDQLLPFLKPLNLTGWIISRTIDWSLSCCNLVHCRRWLDLIVWHCGLWRCRRAGCSLTESIWATARCNAL